MTATEREEKARELMNLVACNRQGLIERSRELAALCGLPANKVLHMVLTRNIAPGYVLNWWKKNIESFQAQWRHDEAYQSAAAKLTPEERKVLGL
jgi:hypothetical protein